MAVAGSRAYSGRCLCGAVAFRATGLEDIWYCHCRQCRRLTGHHMAAARAPVTQVEISGAVRWTPVSENSAHGFCETCCSPLFWRNRLRETISILPGNLDDSSGLEVKGHVFVGEKGDYYEITDGLPQFETWPEKGL